MSKLARFLLALILASIPSVALADPAPSIGDGTNTVPTVARGSRATRASRTQASSESGLAPSLTYGLSIPVTRFGFDRQADGSYGGSLIPIQPGVGASIYWNLIRSANGSVPVALGTTLFGATDPSSRVSDSGLGIAVGPSLFNNTFGLMIGVDLYRRLGDQDTGLLMASAGGKNGFDRRNFFMLFNFGIGLGKSAPGALKIAP